MNIEDKILNKIKEENLKPTSFWYFLLRDYTLWGMVFLSIIFSALSIAPIIFIINNLEIEYIKHISVNTWNFLLSTLPYPFILLAFIFTYLATSAWQKTKNGYKFQGKYVLIISLILSIILGIVLNWLAFGEGIEREFANKSGGVFQSIEDKRQNDWFSPKQGRFIGIVENLNDTSFTLTNEKNNFAIQVDFTDDLPGAEYIENGNSIRIIAYENNDEDNSYTPCIVLPNKFLPTHERKINKDKLNSKIQADTFCKEIISKGRAGFKK